MTRQPIVAVLTENGEFADRLKKAGQNQFVFKRIDPSAGESLLGLETGEIEIELVVIDAEREKSEELFSLAGMLIGAGLPVFISLHPQETPLIWKMASIGVQPLRLDTLVGDFQQALQHRKFDPEALALENEFALYYDVEELSSAATVSAIICENEYVLKQIKAFAQKNKQPLRILDLGCGTGRFEEILLLDPELSHQIERIDAIDFAPMYLKKARERLPHFLSPSQLKKIHFQRRIAEDSRLPSETYDLVIASFGVVCFSRFHHTIPEIHRLLKPSGLAIFNGYNRNSLSYEFVDAASPHETLSLFTAAIDRKKNVMKLKGKLMKCFTFHVDELESFLWYIGLKPFSEETKTFPTLYGCTRKDYLPFFSSKASPGRGHHPQTCCEKGLCNEYASYQTKNLEKDYFHSGFSPVLHQVDTDLTHLLKDRGYYFSLCATK